MDCEPKECLQLYLVLRNLSQKPSDLAKDTSFQPKPDDEETYDERVKAAIDTVLRKHVPVDSKINKPCKQGCDCSDQVIETSEVIEISTPVRIEFTVQGRKTWVKCKEGRFVLMTKSGICYDPKKPLVKVKK